METLKTKLEDWTDWDIAMFSLAQCLGLMSKTVRFNLEAKHVFWTDNPVGKMLYDMLQKLVDTDILLARDEPDKQYKWNPNFLGVGKSRKANEWIVQIITGADQLHKQGCPRAYPPHTHADQRLNSLHCRK
jgi:hypothetical protein